MIWNFWYGIYSIRENDITTQRLCTMLVPQNHKLGKQEDYDMMDRVAFSLKTLEFFYPLQCIALLSPNKITKEEILNCLKGSKINSEEIIEVNIK